MALIVLTNDDGIDAPGIRALQAAVSQPDQCAIVAPDTHLSGCSHQLNRGGIIAIEQRAENEYAIGGTPADCSRVAISHLYPETGCSRASTQAEIWAQMFTCRGR